MSKMKLDYKLSLTVAIMLLLDQATKFWARTKLSTVETIPVLNKFFHLTYVENRGAAFGILQGKSLVFALIALVAITLLAYYYHSQKNKGSRHLALLSYIIAAIVAGALGNLIDRLAFGFVTDFIDFRGIWQFVFNVADIYVVCATFALGLYMLKYDSEN